MELIRHHLHEFDEALPTVGLSTPRSSLAKRRWRGTAQDGQEFGFDLDHALDDGDVIFQSATARYVIVQEPEPVLEIGLPADETEAARLGWLIGNLHFQLEVTPGLVRVADDPAIRQLCERESLAYVPVESVFHPLSGGHTHSHD